MGLPSFKERTFLDGRKLAYTSVESDAHENAKISGNTLSFYPGVCNTYLSLSCFFEEEGRLFASSVVNTKMRQATCNIVLRREGKSL